MSAVVPFLRPARTGSWSQQELAEFYRVEAALIRAGIGIASAHGLSDEGEPWFAFCWPSGDAIIHFARIDGTYLIDSEVLDGPVRGPDFRALIDQIARLHPELLPVPAAGTGTKLVVHPAALLAALVAAAALSLSSEDAHADERGGLDGAPLRQAPAAVAHSHGQTQPSTAKGAGGPGEESAGRKQLEALVLSAMIFAAEAVAADYGDASAESGLALPNETGAAVNPIAQSDAASGSNTALGSEFGSGLGAGAAAQPGGPAAQGSGTSQSTDPAATRIDAGPAFRTDTSGDRAGNSGLETGHRSPSFGLDTALVWTPAEAGALGTGASRTSPPGRAESTTPDGSGARSDAHGGSAAVATADQSPSAPPIDAGHPDPGMGTTPQPRLHAAAHAAADPAPAAHVSRDADSRGHGNGRGPQVEVGAGDSPQVAHPGRGNGQDHASQAHAAAHGETGAGTDTSGSGRTATSGSAHGSAEAGAAPAIGTGSQVGRADGHATPPAEQSDHRGPGADGPPGIGTAADQDTTGAAAHARSDAPGGGPGYAPADPTASSHEPNQAADFRGPGNGRESAAGETSGHGGPDHAPGQSRAASQDDAPSAAHAQGGPPHPPPAHASVATAVEPDDGSAGPRTPHPDGGPEPPGHGSAADHGRGQFAADGSNEQVQAGQSQPSSGIPAAIPTAPHPPLGPPVSAEASHGPAGHAGPMPDRAGPPRTAVDAHGNLVFHGDAHRDPGPPPASQGPDESAAHPGMGLVGISEQTHSVHDLYHHV